MDQRAPIPPVHYPTATIPQQGRARDGADACPSRQARVDGTRPARRGRVAGASRKRRERNRPEKPDDSVNFAGEPNRRVAPNARP